MNRIFFAVACFLSLAFIACSAEDDPYRPDSKSSSGDALLQGFASGWNLGNTLDACSYGDKVNAGLSTECSWGMPYTTKAMIQTVAEKGFRTIRIPVSWHNHMTDSSYSIDSAWLNRVKTIVDWSLDAGMKVIINIHHDNLSESQMSTTYGFCVPENNTALKNQSLSYIKAIWKQTAEFFSEYDERLVFEVLNEPRAVGTSYEWNGSGTSVVNANKIIVEYEQAAIDTIRASGGNNAGRYLMVPPYAASPNMTDGWLLPSDSVQGRLIVSVHAYTPYEFCMNTLSVSTFTDSHKNSIDWLFSGLISQYTSKNIPVIIGEASASDKNNSAERRKWISYYYGKAQSAKIPVILWDNMQVYPDGTDAGERHGWFNRSALSWFFPELVDLMIMNW